MVKKKTTYIPLLLREVFVREFLQRNGADGGVGLISLEGGVGDQGRDVLFELGQVLHDIVLSEVNSIIVVHFLSDAEEELASLEHVYHDSDMLLDLLKCFLGIL